MNDVCVICSQPITVQIFRGSGLCSENCRKAWQVRLATETPELAEGETQTSGGGGRGGELS